MKPLVNRLSYASVQAQMEVILDEAAPTRVVEPGENLSNWKVVNQWGHLPPMDWVQHHNRMVEAETCAA